MEKSPRLIDRMRVEAMMTYICGFRTDSKKHKLLDNFRHRCTTRWTDDERRESDNIHRNMGVTSKFQESMDAEVQEDSRVSMEFFNPSKIKGIREDRVFRAHQHKAIADLHELASQPTEDMSSTLPRAKPPSPSFNYKKSQYITKSVTAIATATLPSSGENLNLKRGRNGTFLSKQTEGYSYIQSRNLSTSQAHVVRQVYEYFCAIDQKRVKETTQRFAATRRAFGMWNQASKVTIDWGTWVWKELHH
jgi:hypothetical protein